MPARVSSRVHAGGGWGSVGDRRRGWGSGGDLPAYSSRRDSAYRRGGRSAGAPRRRKEAACLEYARSHRAALPGPRWSPGTHARREHGECTCRAGQGRAGQGRATTLGAPAATETVRRPWANHAQRSAHMPRALPAPWRGQGQAEKQDRTEQQGQGQGQGQGQWLGRRAKARARGEGPGPRPGPGPGPGPVVRA